MAEITFLATDDDCKTVWEIIFEELSMAAYPDPWFGELPSPALTKPADVAANLKQYPKVAPGLGYFLTSPEWSLEPLEYHLCKDNPKFEPHWYVSQRCGGPSIHFIPRFGYPRHSDTHELIAGMFSDYPYYYSAINHRRIIERPDTLASTMKAIRQRLRSHGKTVRAATGERAIAMDNALAAQARGVVLRAGDIIFLPLRTGRRPSHRT
jgi:hypothetical protein